MFDTYGFLKWETLTETATTFKFPQYRLRNLWRGAEKELDGLTAKWDIYEPSDEIFKRFVHPGAQATKLKLSKRGEQSASTLMTFTYKDVPAEMTANLREMGTNQRAEQRVQRWVSQELAQMRMNVGDQLDEFMLAGMLSGGSLAITVEDVTHTIDYQIPSANKGTAGTAWSDASADVGSDVETKIIQPVENIGYTLKYALASRKVFNALRKNTLVKDYLARQSIGLDAITSGVIPDLFGLTWIRYDLTYASSGSRTRFLPEGHIAAFPEPMRDWTEFQIGAVAVGRKDAGAGLPEFQMVNGFASWFSAEDNPPGFRLYGRYARLPVLKVPAAVAYFDTGIT